MKADRREVLERALTEATEANSELARQMTTQRLKIELLEGLIMEGLRLLDQCGSRPVRLAHYSAYRAAVRSAMAADGTDAPPGRPAAHENEQAGTYEGEGDSEA